MTSRRVVAANRRNARLSTGPRTATGKRTVARNAFRHGLSIPVLADPLLAGDIAELAERLARGFADPQMRELATGIAAPQIDVQRVRHARHALMARWRTGTSATRSRLDKLRGDIRQLVALDRYERQAIWRRKLATQAWQAALFRNIGSAQ